VQFYATLHNRGQKSKLSKVGGMSYPNKGEIGTKLIEKELAQSSLPVMRKIKTMQNIIFLIKMMKITKIKIMMKGMKA